MHRDRPVIVWPRCPDQLHLRPGGRAPVVHHHGRPRHRELDGGGRGRGPVHPGGLPHGPGQVLLVFLRHQAGQDDRRGEREADHHVTSRHSPSHRREDGGAGPAQSSLCPPQLRTVHQQHHG